MKNYAHPLGIIFLIFFAWIGSSLQAQEQQFKINNISIEGNQTVDSTVIRLNSGLIRGSFITGDHVQRAIRNIWALKMFSDIQVLAETLPPGNLVNLTIKVAEYPRLEGWLIKGNDKLDKKDIDKETGFYRGMVFNDFTIYKAQKALIAKYKDEGYLLAQVEIDTSRREDNKVIANLNVKEGEKVQVERIQVFGGSVLTAKELKGAFKEIKENRWWRGADFNRDKYDEDLRNLIAFCRKKGMRD
nr:POTRA domain-containing protein [Calditrichia bacterium]